MEKSEIFLWESSLFLYFSYIIQKKKTTQAKENS
jgi:uncharacterized protein YktB (UPF0637 family)